MIADIATTVERGDVQELDDAAAELRKLGESTTLNIFATCDLLQRVSTAYSTKHVINSL